MWRDMTWEIFKYDKKTWIDADLRHSRNPKMDKYKENHT